MTPRARAFVPWLITAAVCAALVRAVPWPRATGWAVGCVVGTVALVAGVRQLLAEQRPHSSTDEYSSTTRPDDEDQLTAEEARNLADELALDLYRAEDALAYVAEMCDIADEHRGKRGEPATVTTARVREWLKGAQCARQAGLILPAGWLRARADHMEQQ